MKIGKYKLSLLNTGTFALDGGAMFGIIPKPLWQKAYPADELNRIKLGVRCLMLQSDSKNILVDTGMGSGWNEKLSKIYNIDQNSDELTKSLAANGISPDDISDVILTHLHFDHTGGSVNFENNKSIPAFPNAKYHVQKKHFQWAQNPSDRDRGSFINDRFIPLAEEGVLNLIDGDGYFDDEIELITINGHTFGQQMIKLSDSSNTLLYCADLIPTLAHIPVPYVMGYDIQPLETVKEKKKFLGKAVDENWHLIFEHDAYSNTALIKRTEKGFAISELVNIVD